MQTAKSPSKPKVVHDTAQAAVTISPRNLETRNITMQLVNATVSEAGFLSVAANSTTTTIAHNLTTATVVECVNDGDGIVSTVANHLFAGEHSMQEVEGNLRIIWHPDCFLHEIQSHPEQPDRMTFILTALRGNYPPDCFYEAPLATDCQILLFHSADHLSKIKDLCTAAEDGHDCGNSEMYQSVDGDTTVMWRTRRAIWRAAGSVIAAVDSLYESNPLHCMAKSAFCCVRPPGHHASTEKSSGFCFFNNAGIAAKYAQKTRDVKRVAVLDFDVHHGDGTEEGFTKDPTLFYGSTHEKDNFPGTGHDPSPHVGENARDPMHRRIVNRTLTRGPTSVAEFRVKWAQVVEEMVLFKPDFIVFSAGFDAHDEDPLASCELTEADFSWATEIVMRACLRMNPSSPPPLLSVLEGGYDLEALAASVVAHCAVLSAGYPALLETDLALSTADVGQSDEEHGYGGDECAALAAYIASLDI